MDTNRTTHENLKTLRWIGKRQAVALAIKIRELEYFRHLIRNNKYQLEQLTFQGKAAGRRGAGRGRNSWLLLQQWFGFISVQLYQLAVHKIRS